MGLRHFGDRLAHAEAPNYVLGNYMGSQVSAEDEVRAVLDALRRIVRALRLSGAEVEKELGLTAAQLFVLSAIGEEPGCSMQTVAARTHTDPSSVSVVVKKLIDQGLVQRQPSQADGRRAELHASTRGKAILKKAPEPAQAKLRGEIASFSAVDRRGLVRSLSRLVESLGMEESPATMFFEDEGKKTRRRRE